MIPKPIRSKALDFIENIEKGDVNSNDIELLLIWLREFSEAASIFKEVAHFMGHPKRDSGQVFSSLYKLYCRFCAYELYQYQKKTINLSAPVNQWFYDFVLDQLDSCDSKNLKKKYGYSRKEAKKRFRACFSVEDITKNQGRKSSSATYRCVDPKSNDLVNLIKEAASFIKIEPLWNKKQVVESFFVTLESLDLIHSRKNIEYQSHKIFLCILLLLDKREYHIGSNVIGKTTLTSPNDGFGKLEPLEVQSSIETPGGLKLSTSLMSTDLQPEEWVHDSLLIQKETNHKGHFWTVFDQDAELRVGNVGDKYMLYRSKSLTNLSS